MGELNWYGKTKIKNRISIHQNNLHRFCDDRLEQPIEQIFMNSWDRSKMNEKIKAEVMVDRNNNKVLGGVNR